MEKAMSAVKAKAAAEHKVVKNRVPGFKEDQLTKRAVEAESIAATKVAEAEAATKRAKKLELVAAAKAKQVEELEKRADQAEKLLKSNCVSTSQTIAVWECKTGHEWSQYSSSVSAILGSCFSQKKAAQFSLKGQTYEVDCSAQKLVQRNKTTGFLREVRRREAHLDNDVSWACYVDGKCWINYPRDVNNSLETCHRQQTKAVFHISNTPYEIDFRSGKLEQRNVESGTRRPICRRENMPTTKSTPTTWNENPMGQNCSFVSLSKDSSEWGMIQQSLTKTLPNAQLREVLRVQNLLLWEYFCFREDRARKLSAGGNSNVVRVWHGTRTNDPKTICEDEADGFMMQHSRAGMWGQGIYFAADAKYSHSYAHTEKRGVSGGSYWDTVSGRITLSTLIMARLVAGEETHMGPDSKLRQCPEKSGESRRYDTITGTNHGTKVYVVYENGRAYPEYLVTYSVRGTI